MPTIKDVAKEAGVSIATVSYSLNNRTDLVKEATRIHILEVAQHLGYRPNVAARNLQSSKAGLIGYAWHHNPNETPNLLMDQFMYELAQASESLNYYLLTFTHPKNDPIRVYDDLIRSGRVDGFVLAETQINDPRIRFFIDKNIPFVSFGRANDDWEFNWVDTNGKVGMQQATQHLIELGHERIAFLGWTLDSLGGNYRLAGYKTAMKQANLPIHKYLVVHSDYIMDSEVVEERFAEWQEMPIDQRPTAIVAISDYVAVGVMRLAESYGYRIGETMSIVGFDDVLFSQFMEPGLTSVRQPLKEIAVHLVTTLDRSIAGELTGISTHLFSPTLIVRGSTGVPQDE